MRTIMLTGAVAGAAMFALIQAASAERICKEVCEGGACVQRCVEHDDRTIIDRDRGPRPMGPGVDVEIHR
jgi:hypothetical protein